MNLNSVHVNKEMSYKKYFVQVKIPGFDKKLKISVQK